MALGSTQSLTKMSTRNISWGVKAVGARADNLTAFIYRLSWNLGASTSWNPQGLSRPVIGLLLLISVRGWEDPARWNRRESNPRPPNL